MAARSFAAAAAALFAPDHEEAEDNPARSGLRPRVLPPSHPPCDAHRLHVVPRHGGEDAHVRPSAAGVAPEIPTTGHLPIPPGEDSRRTAARTAADFYAAAHRRAGVSYGQTARVLGVSQQHIARLAAAEDADPRAVTVRDVLAGPAPVRREMARLLAAELLADAEVAIPQGRTAEIQALRLGTAAARVGEAVMSGDAAAIARASAALETERRILEALVRRGAGGAR